MAPTAHFLQREFCAYLDARYRVEPENDRPDGVDPSEIPTITVTRDADGPEAIFTTTLLWRKMVRSHQCTTQNLTALLLAEGRKPLILDCRCSSTENLMCDARC